MTQPIWNTPAGSLGTFPSLRELEIHLSATPVFPGTSLTYKLLSGTFPDGVFMDEEGFIQGVPTNETRNTSSSFTIRVTDNKNIVRDRTFSMSVSGAVLPFFTTPLGSILSTWDSIWVELPIQFTNPDPTATCRISVRDGRLPPGLEINEAGVIMGYASPPMESNTLAPIITIVSDTTAVDNTITCTSTNGFSLGRPVVFSGDVMFGNLNQNTTYYVKNIVSTTTFTVATTQDGPEFSLINGAGTMQATLITTTVGQPTIKTFNFTLKITNDFGMSTAAYSITVINQNTPVSQGGPGKNANTRTPVTLNTRPRTIVVSPDDEYYGYYLLPPVDPTVPANIGTVMSGDYFAFKVIGHDFDSGLLTYAYSQLPLGLVGDPETGWITGVPIISTGISSYYFSVNVLKNGVLSTYFNFTLRVSNGVKEAITWVTPENLGTLFNGTISSLRVQATADVPLNYRLIAGELPPHLTLLDNGELTGYVAHQPTDQFLNRNERTEFTFTIEAHSLDYAILYLERTFTVTVLQEYAQPTETVYIKATPSLADRRILNTLLTDETLIPSDFLYRPNDIYFGKATSVIYNHAYGVFASDIDEYLRATNENHYWRNITLGEIKTALAKNDAGEVIYEVVYSEVIDDIANNEPDENPLLEDLDRRDIYWPRDIDLGLGPWYTASTNIFTSYNYSMTFFTSLDSGNARILFPNSLKNMRDKLTGVLGQSTDTRFLPLWMTSQQKNGSTTGYVQAWVICYTKPGKSDIIKANIDRASSIPEWAGSRWPYSLNQINFKIDRLTVNKSLTYDYDKNMSPAAWTGLPSAEPVPEPIDSKDFYVLYPRKTILPDKSQY